MTCIEEMKNWMASNRLKLNTDKTVYTSRNTATTRQDNLCLNKPRRIKHPFVDSVTCLGVIIDSELKLDMKIRRVSSRCMYYLRQLRTVR